MISPLLCIGIGIFALAVIWGAIMLPNWGFNKRRRGAKPSIEVRPVNDFDDYYLEVKNTGSTGTFEAQIEMLEGHIFEVHKLDRYSACWESTRGRQAQIVNSLTDRVRIARFVSHPPYYQTQHLDLYYHDPQTSQEEHVDSDSYIVGATVTSKNGKERPLTRPEFILRVTINAAEGLREGPFIKKYKLGLGGLEELPNN